MSQEPIEIPSRSMLRRKALQSGGPLPVFCSCEIFEVCPVCNPVKHEELQLEQLKKIIKEIG